MGDLAESIDDLICTFENVANQTMDTLAMIIFLWILIALFVLWLAKFLYNRFILKRNLAAAAASTSAATPIIPGSALTTPIVATDLKVAETKLSASVDALVEKKIKKSVNSSPKGGGAGSSGYVPPTPPVRKRLSRRSPGPDLLTKPHHHVKPAPKCTGPDPVSVEWVNLVFQWLFNDFVVVNEFLHEWILSLNEFTKKSVTEHGVGVEFMRFLPETGAPSLTNVYCECDSKEDVTITCDCDATAALQLKCFRQKGEKVEISHYRVNINRFRARLNIVAISEKLLADLKCDGWPEIKINLAPVGTIKNNLDEQQLQDVITEIITTALRNTQLHMNLSQYPTCPHLVRHPVTPAQVLPVHYDGMNPQSTSTPNSYYQSNGVSVQGDKRLLVKIIRATDLKLVDDVTPMEPYCVVEMDEPFQKNQTSVKKGTNSPMWDEHFLFDISTNTAELLFEVYDRANKTNRFLGLGIVGVDELLINPSQRQIISLQTRPYETDNVTGTLIVEFLFVEGADIPISGSQPYKIKESLRTVSPSGQLITTTRTTFEGQSMTNGTLDLTDSALRELERNKQQGANANKSTLIIHSVQRQPFERQTVKVTPQKDGSFQEDDEIPEITDKKDEENKPGELQTSTDSPTNENNSSSDAETRGRSRRKRDFFGTIRRRFGRSQTRSKSAGRFDTQNEPDDVILNRSISAERSRSTNQSGPHDDSGIRLSVPTLNKSLGESNSRRSSLSEASGISGTSTRTYLNEASTLVLETLENGVKKHYLVPLSLAQKSRWRKKGTKLHIFSDHTFIAKHLTGGTVCQVCSKSIARRIGKQGYECRDCLIKCHKQCHVKINDNCPSSTIHNMELSYITNPITDKNLRII